MMNPEVIVRLDEIARCLESAQRVLFITGAGISSYSGLPTYRGVGGLYDGTATDEGLRIEEILSGEFFAHRPDLTWKYLLQIEENCRAAKPNAAHQAIAQLESSRGSGADSGVLILTQNVDGLHRAAGSRNLIEIHGNLQTLICTACDHQETVSELAQRSMPPRCPRCQAVLRPDVVLFGESLPEPAVDRLLDEMAKGFDLVFTIGTSNAFPYIVEPVVEALQNGVPTVEINPGKTVLSELVDYPIPLGAAEAMQAIMARLTVGR